MALEIIQNSSIFEIAVTEDLSAIESLPPWLIDGTNKKELFNEFISNNNLREAWFTLNAKGWLLKDVADALLQLESKSHDELLSLVADNWIDGWQKSTFLNSSY